MRSSELKTLDYLELRDEFQTIRDSGKKIIHCHGVFDLLHPGHITHLQQAKAMGDVLVVSITSARYVNKGPDRPYFNDETRLNTVAALEMVDYVVLSDYPTAIEVISAVKPDYYIKGMEYRDINNDVTGEIKNEIDEVEKYGGQVRYTEGQVFSSTKLINNNFSSYTDTTKCYLENISRQYPFEVVRDMIESFKDLKVLVIGDVIIDEYVFCDVKGLMSKDRAYSALYKREDQYLGGVLAVANHISSFVDNVTVLSIIGDETKLHSKILNDLANKMHFNFITDSNFKTSVKRRYIEKHGMRDEYNKLFSMNFLMDDDEIKGYDRKLFHANLEECIENFDIVIVTDYGHGIMDGRAIEIVEKRAKYLAVNAQTNSTNYGINLITRYNRADTFTLDQREIGLAFSTNSKDYNELMLALREKLSGKNAWLTLGSEGCVGINELKKIDKAPALTLEVKDTIGAGDAFYAITSLCAVKGLPLEIGSLLGNMAGAIAANVIGNSKEIDKVSYLKYLKTILNF